MDNQTHIQTNNQPKKQTNKRVIFYIVFAALGLLATALPWMSINVSLLNFKYSFGSGFTIPSHLKSIINGTSTLFSLAGISAADIPDKYGITGLPAMYGFSLLIFAEPILYGVAAYFWFAKKDKVMAERMMSIGFFVLIVMAFFYMIACANLNGKLEQAVNSGTSSLGASFSVSIKLLRVNSGLILALIVGVIGALYSLIGKRKVTAGSSQASVRNPELFRNSQSAAHQNNQPKVLPGPGPKVQTPQSKMPEPQVSDPEVPKMNSPKIKAALTLRSDEPNNMLLEISTFPTVIGSDSSQASQVLSDPSVAPAHCKLIVHDGHILVCDLHSVSGVMIDDEKIPDDGYFMLLDGDHLKIGDVDLTVNIDQNALRAVQTGYQPKQAAPTAEKKPISAIPESELEETVVLPVQQVESHDSSETLPINFNGGDSQFPDRILTWLDGRDTFVITKTPFILGKDPEKVDFVINDRGVSHKHLQIVRENGQFYVEDLHSKNGFKLNGVLKEPGTKARIHEGDTITIGVRRYKFEK